LSPHLPFRYLVLLKEQYETILLLLFLAIAVTAFAQPGDSIKRSHERRLLISNDSVVAKLKDSVLNSPGFDSIQVRENIDRNMSGMLQMQKEQKVRDKRAATIRIAIGMALLIVLIIGLRRKMVKVKGRFICPKVIYPA
jgi:hypothetical protein